MNEQEFFKCLLKVFVWLVEKAYGVKLCTPKQGELKVMANYKLQNDHPPVQFDIEVGEVKDADGEVITDPVLTYDVQVQDPNVLGVEMNADGKSGTLSFGHSGVSGWTAEVKNDAGEVLGSGGDIFTLTQGPPESVASVNTTFAGLTPEPEQPVATPVDGGA